MHRLLKQIHLITLTNIKSYKFKNEGFQYASIDEVNTIQEQMWNAIAHIKQQFGFIFCGFGDFKQLKPTNEEHIDF